MTTSINISEEAGVRFLHFSSEWIQGAMRIARPWNLELEYTREMMASLLLREGGGIAAGHPPAVSIPPSLRLDADCLPLVYPSRVLRDDARWPRKVLRKGGGAAAGHPPAYPWRVLLIGLGAASLTKFLYRNHPLAHLTVVEIEPNVVAAAQQYFKLPEDPKRINLVIGDGMEYVANNDKKFDLILVDGYDEDASSGALDTLLFYQWCRARLSNAGILSVNLLTSNGRLDASISRIAEAFDNRVLGFPSCESGNAIALAAAGDPIDISLDDMKESALALKEATGLNLLPTLTRLTKAKTCLNNRLIL
jgi:spermidine synthase